jgi:hypothetical protein
MTAAEKIMKKKEFIKHEADMQLPKAQSDKLWRKATAELDKILARYADLPKGVHTHTDSFIFPTAAIYLTYKAAVGEEKAYGIVEKAAAENAGSKGKKLANLMRIPGMPSLFIKIWDPMTIKIFGPKCGFKNRFYPKKKGEYRMDVLECPYNKYFTELGCQELTKLFCRSDELAYGNLPGLNFIRTSTIGRGGERCDFYLRRAK